MKVPTVLLVRRRAAESLKLPRSALLVLENNPCFGLPGVYILSGLGGSHPTSTALPAFLPSALLTHPALAAQAELSGVPRKQPLSFPLFHF